MKLKLECKSHLDDQYIYFLLKNSWKEITGYESAKNSKNMHIDQQFDKKRKVWNFVGIYILCMYVYINIYV